MSIVNEKSHTEINQSGIFLWVYGW